MKWNDNNTIQIVPPKKPKKLTGTRFATILGLNPWSTPFEIWAEITRVYDKPFEQTIYTEAGKTIEPKQAQYMRDNYFMTLTAPADVWGEDYFSKTYGDFYPENPVLGGMWDYLRGKSVKDATAVLEMKTTKRVEDWADDIPEYYALQAALYAYLLGVDDVIMVTSFLEDKDYKDPSKFECNVHNTITRPFKVSERYPDFEAKYVKPALAWWREHVEGGVSPIYDEKKDAEVLKALRTNNLNPDTDINALVSEAEALKAKLDAHATEIADDEKRYKKLTELIKQAAVEKFREGDKKVALTGKRFTWEVSKSSTVKINKDALKADGLLEKYSTLEESYRLVPKEIKEDEK